MTDPNGSVPASKIEHLCFSYAGKPILRDVDLRIEAGSFTVFLGPNGSGKTTLLKLIAGILEPTSGNISLFGEDLKQMPLRKRARRVGYLAQQQQVVFPFRTEDVVLTGRAGVIRFQPKAEDIDAAVQAMKDVGIAHLLHQPFTELSGGEQQLVMIARVVAQNPKLLLLDEPTSHLDLHYQSRVLRFIQEWKANGHTVVAVLHDPNHALIAADRIVLLKQGRVVGQGGPDEIRIQQLEDVYRTRLVPLSYRDQTVVFSDIDGGFTSDAISMSESGYET
ncbi:MAG: ABC transporter ATP-binding protein [Thermodesulfobacteriota bacterium]